MPDGNIAVIGKGTQYEEYVFILKLSTNFGTQPSIWNHADPTAYSTVPDRMRFVVSQRNLTQNHNLFLTSTIANAPKFNKSQGALWITQANTGFTYYTHPIGTPIEWWDWREGMTQSLCINHENYHKALPEGLPILKNTGYWGSNEPTQNTNFPPTYTDASFYTALLKENYSTGFSYFLYYNRLASAGGLDAINDLPDSVYRDNMVTSTSGQFGINRGGVPMLLLTEAINQTSNDTSTIQTHL